MTCREVIELGAITKLGSYAFKSDTKKMITIFNFALKKVYSDVPALTVTQNINLKDKVEQYRYNDNAYKILYAQGSCTKDVPVNSLDNELSIHDLGNHFVHIPEYLSAYENSITLVLQGKPPTITEDNIDSVDFLPDDALIAPILSYMAFMVSQNIAEQNGQIHLQEYSASIRDVTLRGVFHSRTAYTPNSWT